MPTEPDPQMRLFNTAPRGQGPASYEAMMNIEPHARNSDSVGSFEAAERLHRTALSGRQRLAVYHALRDHQGATSKELAEFMGVDRHTPARRLKELEDAGWVRRGRQRKCRVSGVESLTWYIVRPWIDKPDRRAHEDRRPSPLDCSDEAPKDEASRLDRKPSERPARVTTPEDRRRLREKLAATADERTRRFLAELSKSQTEA